MGAAVERFETEYAAYIGARHAIGVGTGLSAIELALRAFEHRPRRRGDHAGEHVHRDRARDPGGRRHAGVRRHGCGDLRHRRGRDRRGGHLADQGDRAGASLRPAGRHRCGPRGRAAAPPARHRGRGAGARRALQGPARRQLRRRRRVQLLPVEESRRARRRRHDHDQRRSRRRKAAAAAQLRPAGEVLPRRFPAPTRGSTRCRPRC